MKLGSGQKWALWEWEHIGIRGSKYIDRLKLIRTPLGGIQLHWIHRQDDDRHPHNHPRTFFRMVLRGGYFEYRYHMHILVYKYGKSPNGLAGLPYDIKPFRPSLIRKKQFFHRIDAVLPGTISLCIVGPRGPEWGFMTETGFIEWPEYIKGVRNAN